MINKTIDGRFQIKEKIGAGSFGEVYIALDIKTGENVAVKVEPAEIQTYQLYNESTIYKILEGATNIPKFYWFGSYSTNKSNTNFTNWNNKTNLSNNVMAIELLGKSLKELFLQCNRHFSLKTVLMIIDQMLSSIQLVHNRHFVHRDLKPENFVIGLNNKKNQLYMIDFGLARKYRDPQTLDHKPCLTNIKAAGTPRYTSINALKGLDQSRRDDMESLGYIWIYFLKGSLPWMGIPNNERDPNRKYMTILHIKKHLSIEELCSGLPTEFIKYFKDVRSLKYRDEPDYSGYRKMFRDLFSEQGYVFDYQYDWVAKKPKEKHETPSNSPKKINIKIKKNDQSENLNQIKNRPKSTKRLGVYCSHPPGVQHPSFIVSPPQSPENEESGARIHLNTIENDASKRFLSKSARRIQQPRKITEKEQTPKIQRQRKKSAEKLPQIARECCGPQTKLIRLPSCPKRYAYMYKTS